MTLEDYLASKGLTQEEFALSIGISQSTVSRLSSGTGNASLALLKDIFEATRGAVTPNDFLPQEPIRKRRGRNGRA